MARVFTITAVDNGVSLDKNGSGEITFTVSNVSTRPIRGRVKVVALESAKPEWLTVAGEAERDFSAGATHQFTVKITVPPNTAAARCSFRVDAENVANKDEEYDEGPSVAFKVEEQKKEGGFPLWIIPVIVGMLVIVGVVIFLLIPKKVPVPDVTNIQVAEARLKLEDAGLVAAETEEPAAGVAQGQVIRQDPESETEVKRGSEVALVVAAPPPDNKVQVPNVVRLPIERARQEIAAKGLQVAEGAQTPTLEFTPGEVTKQSPPAFEAVEPGSIVTLSVAGKSVRVPVVAGFTLSAAMQEINRNKLFVANVTGTKPEEKVLSTTPAGSTVVLEASNVTIHMPGNFTVFIPKSRWRHMVELQR